MLDLVGAALAVQCDALVLCGRVEEGFACLPDRPGPDLGPLAGLNAALHHAVEQGFDTVLSAGCDVPNLPATLAQSLGGEGPAIVDDQPIVGLWPSQLAVQLDNFLSDGSRALYGFAESVKARRVTIEPPLMNVNRPEDLE
jgi:molybdopterin-guanine dinucleotide biosynthesis protein A